MTHWFRNTSNGRYFGIVRVGERYRVVLPAGTNKPTKTPAEIANMPDHVNVSHDDALKHVRENYQTGWEE